MDLECQRLYDKLLATLPRVPHHPLREYRDALKGDTLDEACSWGMYITTDLGRTEIRLDGGLTEEHYKYFVPVLTYEGRSRLAKGVLEKKMDAWPFWEQSRAFHLCCDAYGISEIGGLAELCEKRGFDAIIQEMRDMLDEYRQTHAPPAAGTTTVVRPRWHRETRTIEYGLLPFRPFRSDAWKLLSLLDAVEENDWRPTNVTDPKRHGTGKFYLYLDQVRDASKQLNHRTRPHITWSVPNDGTLHPVWR
jgi:hypothetical protein